MKKGIWGVHLFPPTLINTISLELYLTETNTIGWPSFSIYNNV